MTLVMGIALFKMDNIDPDEMPIKHWVWDAIFNARLQALQTKEKTVLYYDAEARAFQIKALEMIQQTIPIPPNHTGDITVNFFPLLSVDGRDSFEAEYAEEPILELAFYSSGASVPVRIMITNSEADDLELTPDPFASYFIEDEDE